MSDSMIGLISSTVEKILADGCEPGFVRRVEQCMPVPPQEVHALWQTLQDAGLVDALVSEQSGGAGLSVADVLPILIACGRHGLPLPLAMTMLARGALDAHGQALPDGAIAIAPGALQEMEAGFRCADVPGAHLSQWVMAPVPDGAVLLPTSAARMEPAAGDVRLGASLVWSGGLEQHGTVFLPVDCRLLGAFAASAMLAGTMERVLAMTIDYAGTRTQFGKAIGKFQAIQQQVSVMAEEVLAAGMSVQLAAGHGEGLWRQCPQSARHVALAKARTGQASLQVARVAHAVHGAIGFTDECDLHLFTRRLYGWRSAFGGESFWYRWLGRSVLVAGSEQVLDAFGRADTLSVAQPV